MLFHLARNESGGLCVLVAASSSQRKTEQLQMRSALATQRNEARLAGCPYLVYIVGTMSSTILFATATAGQSTSEVLATLGRMISTARTVLLDLVQILCARVLSITLYRLTKTVDATFALLAMCLRVDEGLLGCLPLLGKLELIQLVTTPMDQFAGLSQYTAFANEIPKRPDNGLSLSQWCFVVGGFIFGTLLLAGRLIPRWLAWIGSSRSAFRSSACLYTSPPSFQAPSLIPY
jgi:hypothetical protein